MGKNQRWTKEEVEILTNNYGKVEIEHLMKLLPQRTKNSIVNKATNLNITQSHTTWTEDEIDKLKKLFPDNTTQELCDEFNRSYHSISRKAQELNLKKSDVHKKVVKEKVRNQNTTWDESEDDIIRKYFPEGGYKAVLEHLPYRNQKTIYARAQRLGVKRLGKFNYRWDREVVSVDDFGGSRKVVVKFTKKNSWE